MLIQSGQKLISKDEKYSFVTVVHLQAQKSQIPCSPICVRQRVSTNPPICRVGGGLGLDWSWQRFRQYRRILGRRFQKLRRLTVIHQHLYTQNHNGSSLPSWIAGLLRNITQKTTKPLADMLPAIPGSINGNNASNISQKCRKTHSSRCKPQPRSFRPAKYLERWRSCSYPLVLFAWVEAKIVSRVIFRVEVTTMTYPINKYK